MYFVFLRIAIRGSRSKARLLAFTKLTQCLLFGEEERDIACVSERMPLRHRNSRWNSLSSCWRNIGESCLCLNPRQLRNSILSHPPSVDFPG